MGKIRILILGGTTEARMLAQALSVGGPDVMSRLPADPDPLPQPVFVRFGGWRR